MTLKRAIPSIALDLQVCRHQQFYERKIVPAHYQHYMVTKNCRRFLTKVQAQLKKCGLGLKIFDAYRPYSVTEKMWEPVQDDRYAADPKKGSGHNRGIAVDLTIINLKKKELNMGTGFDNFSDSAHHAFTNLPEQFCRTACC
jgi:D-alanyl-D-alanine dipeptidase